MVGRTLRVASWRGKLSNICSFAAAKCQFIRPHAVNAYQNIKELTYCCNSRVYISSVHCSIMYRVAQSKE